LNTLALHACREIRDPARWICGSACVGRHHPQRFAWLETKLEWGVIDSGAAGAARVRDTGKHATGRRDGGSRSGRIELADRRTVAEGAPVWKLNLEINARGVPSAGRSSHCTGR